MNRQLVEWFLNVLSTYDKSDIDCDSFEVIGEDENGCEGHAKTITR